jgi:hypothetical protein
MIALAYVIGDGLFSPHVDPSLGQRKPMALLLAFGKFL